MIKKYNNLSFLFFIPGVVIQIVSMVMAKGDSDRLFATPSAVAVFLVGTVLALIGFAYYAKAKGRSIAWALFAVIGLPGLAMLAILKDRSGDPWNT
jgi:hypothetical protein